MGVSSARLCRWCAAEAWAESGAFAVMAKALLDWGENNLSTEGAECDEVGMSKLKMLPHHMCAVEVSQFSSCILEENLVTRQPWLGLEEPFPSFC